MTGLIGPATETAPARILVDQARTLVRELTVADELVGRIDPGLRDRVQVRLSTTIARLRTRARALQDQVRAYDEVPAGRAPGVDAGSGWADLRALRLEADELLAECLLLVEGSTARATGIDDGWCLLADALVDELAARTPIGRWDSFTVPAPANLYRRASRAIQLRFPSPTVWDLPILAHELGHFVGPAIAEDVGLSTEHPVDRVFAARGDASEESWSHLQELVADALASHLVGPAYGLTCVTGGFDPLTVLVDSPTHPAAGHRVAVITAVLRSREDGSFDWAADQIEAIWDRLVEASEGAAGRDPLGSSPYADEVVALVREQLPVSGYGARDAGAPGRTDNGPGGWDAAVRLAGRLRDGPPAPPYAIADLLNGAWLARLQCTSAAGVDRVAGHALTALRGSRG